MKHLKKFESTEGIDIDIESIKDILLEISDEYPELKVEYYTKFYNDDVNYQIFRIKGFDRIFHPVFDDVNLRGRVILDFWETYGNIINLITQSCKRIKESQKVNVEIVGLNDIGGLPTPTSDRILLYFS